MADLTLIRNAIAAALTDAFGPDSDQADYAFDIEPRVVSPPPNLPSLQVLKGPTEWDEAEGGALAKYTFVVRALLPFPATDDDQQLLDDLLSFPGDRSIKAALETRDGDGTTQSTLGGVVGDLTVRGDTGHRIIDMAGGEYLSADVNVEVWA